MTNTNWEEVVDSWKMFPEMEESDLINYDRISTEDIKSFIREIIAREREGGYPYDLVAVAIQEAIKEERIRIREIIEGMQEQNRTEGQVSVAVYTGYQTALLDLLTNLDT